jgi:hypothetical protein
MPALRMASAAKPYNTNHGMRPGLPRWAWPGPCECGTLVLLIARDAGGPRRHARRSGAPGQTWMLVTGCALSVRFMVPAMTLLGPSS